MIFLDSSLSHLPHGMDCSPQCLMVDLVDNPREIANINSAACSWIEMNVSRFQLLGMESVSVGALVACKEHGQGAAFCSLFLGDHWRCPHRNRLDLADLNGGGSALGLMTELWL